MIGSMEMMVMTLSKVVMAMIGSMEMMVMTLSMVEQGQIDSMEEKALIPMSLVQIVGAHALMTSL